IRIIFAFLAVSAAMIPAQSSANTDPTKPPALVASKYQTSINWTVSDNFNTLDFSKWTYRTQGDPSIVSVGVGSSYAYIVNQGGTSFVSLRGSGSTKKGGGISALNTAHYGFYIAKFRLIGGFNGTNSTVWHPAIWGSPFNMAGKSLNPVPSNWVEIDFMEWKQGTSGWDSHMIPRVNNVTENSSKWPYFFTEYGAPDHSSWKIIGLEYEGDIPGQATGMQTWEFVNGSWIKRGPKIWYSGYENTRGKLLGTCRSPQYWVLSNPNFVPARPWAFYQGDSWMHVDYFYHYKWK
ncbi:MAG: hypothetical protein AAF571_15110, partial [Verrucomicrobiota bacterium]